MNKIGIIGLSGLVVATAFMAGCAPKNSLVGEWEGSGGGFGAPGAQAGNATFKFNNNDTFEIISSGDGMTMKMSGSYTLAENNKISMKINDAGLQGNFPEEMKSMKPLMDSMFESMKGQSFAATYEFASADEVTLNIEPTGAMATAANAPKAEPVTLKRK